MGKGQCGQCAAERRVMIAHNVKELDNYIACDDETLSEIVVPCLVSENLGESGSESGEKVLRTVLDIDSDRIGTFDAED